MARGVSFEVEILFVDVYPALESLDDNSIDVAITSPPYWKQRDYGFEGQVGQEPTPEEYVGRLVKIYSVLRRKLRPEGVFFLNVGDKYFQRYGFSQLLQLPYRLAWHMVKDGWRLLDVLIWYKPNHMPSPVSNRFANTYEPVFVFAKSEKNAYLGGPGVLKITLEQVPWKHTAVFPTRLVVELLRRVRLREGARILDPFAGTGTVGVAAAQVYPSSKVILIEKGEEFVEIMKQRLPGSKVVKVKEVPYSWEPVQEDELSAEPLNLPMEKRKGLVYLAEDEGEFLSALAGLAEEKTRWREDAVFFLGVKGWGLASLYYPGLSLRWGLVLRNMLVVERGGSWFPVFMFARDTKRVRYRFHLDRLRKPSEFKLEIKPAEEYLGLEVSDAVSKRRRRGVVVGVGAVYPDGFPKVLWVRWEGGAETAELVLHPAGDHEELRFLCPFCGAELSEPFAPYERARCPRCGRELWKDLSSVPRVEEPRWVKEAFEELGAIERPRAQVARTRKAKAARSKFRELERLNWGASPGARQAVSGERFTLLRLYRVDQPMVAQFLNLARKERGLSVKGVAELMPPGYEHTAGHWFRFDFGGSIPAPEDLKILAKILGIEAHPLTRALLRRALKLQTVRPHPKGRNPGDLVSGIGDLKAWLSELFL